LKQAEEGRPFRWASEGVSRTIDVASVAVRDGVAHYEPRHVDERTLRYLTDSLVEE
jgi:hypothetical protein